MVSQRKINDNNITHTCIDHHRRRQRPKVGFQFNNNTVGGSRAQINGVEYIEFPKVISNIELKWKWEAKNK